MLIGYKIVITLTAIMHVIGFGMAVSNPASMADQFGVEYNDSLFKLIFHFGLLLMIFFGISSSCGHFNF